MNRSEKTMRLIMKSKLTVFVTTLVVLIINSCCVCPQKEEPLTIEFRGDSLYHVGVDRPVNNKEVINEK